MDGQSLFSHLQQIPDAAAEVFERSLRQSPLTGRPGVRSVALSGVGEAALAADLFAASVRHALPVPVLTSAEAQLPAFVGGDTLVIVISAGGDADETVQALSDAVGKGASIVVIAAGGRLIEMAEAQNFPHVALSSEALVDVLQLSCLFFALWGAFSSAAVPAELRLPEGEAHAARTFDLLRRQRRAFAPEQPEESNPARQLAAALEGVTPVVFGGDPLSAAAARAWRARLRVVAERLAFRDDLPSPLGFVNAGPSVSAEGGANFTGIVLHEEEETPLLRRKTEVAARELGSPCHQISLDGASALERLWGAVYLADWAAFYAAR